MEGRRCSASAKRAGQRAKRQESDQRASHMRSLAVITATKRMVVEELEIIGWNACGSVSNRNGGSHMMLDNKTEQR